MDCIASFVKARNLLQNIVRKPPLILSEYLSAATGNNVYLKAENIQLTGAYKVRGALYKISTLPREILDRGIITSSAGNHAQGVAYAAHRYNAKAVIVMPTTTPLVKVNNTKRYGAEVVLAGDLYDEAYQHALELSEKYGYEFVHPFNDLTIATGQGTIAYDILEALPETDTILVPIGGGGLAAGISTLAKLLRPEVQVIGVEPRGAACMQASLKAGKVVSLPQVETIADGVAVMTPGDKIFPYVQANVDTILTVDDTEIPDAFLGILENHKMLVENAGLISVAALSQLPAEGKNVVAVLSGGNMDVITMSSLVQHGLINRGRVFTFSLLLPDKPGELARITEIIAKESGNVIRLAHNQFVNINRYAAVELTVTLEAYGHEHRERILNCLRAGGYEPQLEASGSLY